MAVVLLQIINVVFTLYSFAIIARALLSWFRIGYHHPVARFLIQITEPVLAPLRRLIPPMGGADITPMIALFVLWAAERLLQALVVMLF